MNPNYYTCLCSGTAVYITIYDCVLICFLCTLQFFDSVIAAILSLIQYNVSICSSLLLLPYLPVCIFDYILLISFSLDHFLPIVCHQVCHPVVFRFSLENNYSVECIISLPLDSPVLGYPPRSLWRGTFCSISSANDGTIIPPL